MLRVTGKSSDCGDGVRLSRVTLYWRPMCGYCETLKAHLIQRDVPFTAVDIWQDRSKAALVRAATGGDEIVPTVQVGDRFYVNPAVDEIIAALEG
jgi:mycoredoxin